MVGCMVDELIEYLRASLKVAVASPVTTVLPPRNNHVKCHVTTRQTSCNHHVTSMQSLCDHQVTHVEPSCDHCEVMYRVIHRNGAR